MDKFPGRDRRHDVNDYTVYLDYKHRPRHAPAQRRPRLRRSSILQPRRHGPYPYHSCSGTPWKSASIEPVPHQSFHHSRHCRARRPGLFPRRRMTNAANGAPSFSILCSERINYQVDGLPVHSGSSSTASIRSKASTRRATSINDGPSKATNTPSGTDPTKSRFGRRWYLDGEKGIAGTDAG